MFNKRLLTAAVAAAHLSTIPAYAAPQLEEVVVTAQRKAESLQDAPISITAFGTEGLETFGIEGLGDVGANVPNMNVRPFPTSNSTLRIKIRGVGTNDTQVTQDPAIGVYLNDVYIARATGLAMDTADLRSIEVLKGPQGTLFGRNAVGGAIKMETIPPSIDGLEFKQKLSAGNFDYLQSRTMINQPLGDSIAAKLVYVRSSKDGYVDNLTPGKDFLEKHAEGGRFDLRWHVNQHMTVDYGYDFSRSEQVNPTYQAVTLPYNTGVTGYRSGYTDPNSGLKTGPSPLREIVPYSEHRLTAFRTFAPLKPTDTAIDGHALNINWDLDWGVVKSISAYRTLDEQRYTDLGLGGSEIRIDANGVRTPTEQDQFSQEFQLQGDLVDGRVSYVTGLYYFKEHATENVNTPRKLSAVNWFFLDPIGDSSIPITYLNTFSNNSAEVKNSAKAIYGQADIIPPFLEDKLTVTLGVRYTEDRRYAAIQTESITYQSGSSSESGSFSGESGVLGTANDIVARSASVDGEGSETFENLSYLLVLSYDWNDDVSSYFKVGTSYKSGGYNMREGAPERLQGDDAKGLTEKSQEAISMANATVTKTFEDGFDSEEVTGYELGVKSELFDRRVRLNAAAFYTEYDDIQLNLGIPETPSPADTNVFNAGVARIQGIELDITALLTEAITLTVGYGYTDAEYTELEDPRSTTSEPNLVFTGAPQHSYTVSLDYAFEPFDFGVLTANLNYVWQDEVITDGNDSYSSFIQQGTGNIITIDPEYVASLNNPNQPVSEVATGAERSKLDEYGLLNGRITLSNIPALNGSFKISLWGKNLEDKEYVIDSVTSFAHADRAVLFGEPRSYGLDLSYEY